MMRSFCSLEMRNSASMLGDTFQRFPTVLRVEIRSISLSNLVSPQLLLRLIRADIYGRLLPYLDCHPAQQRQHKDTRLLNNGSNHNFSYFHPCQHGQLHLYNCCLYHSVRKAERLALQMWSVCRVSDAKPILWCNLVPRIFIFSRCRRMPGRAGSGASYGVHWSFGYCKAQS